MKEYGFKSEIYQKDLQSLDLDKLDLLMIITILINKIPDEDIEKFICNQSIIISKENKFDTEKQE